MAPAPRHPLRELLAGALLGVALVGVMLLVCLLLTSCATPAPPPPAAHCLPLTPFDAAKQQQIGIELAGLADSDPLRALGGDWIAMRDADRACIAAQAAGGAAKP